MKREKSQQGLIRNLKLTTNTIIHVSAWMRTNCLNLNAHEFIFLNANWNRTKRYTCYPAIDERTCTIYLKDDWINDEEIVISMKKLAWERRIFWKLLRICTKRYKYIYIADFMFIVIVMYYFSPECQLFYTVKSISQDFQYRRID